MNRFCDVQRAFGTRPNKLESTFSYSPTAAMTDSTKLYENPLITRYASAEMAEQWGSHARAVHWRRLWLALAESQQELGLPISATQLQQMRDHQDDICWETIANYEATMRHDVMAHLHAFGDLCPEAKPIMHWGATSCFVTDNSDLLMLRGAMELVAGKVAAVVDRLATFAEQHQDLACLAFTHMQPAQPTTVGKRATLWAYDLVLDLQEMEHRLQHLAARSVRGTTGSQASFLKLFDGDRKKVAQLQHRVAEKMGFEKTYSVTGQTYTRKIDSQILDVLSGLAQSAHKAATDLRLLANRREIEEPFESGQVGSSAMAYKRNPMRCERICSLARFVISLQSSTAMTVATQWMERTLDDSANRRLTLPQAFLATDAILGLYENVSRALVVYPNVIKRNLEHELPFMATENILMAAVAAGGDRQALHEVIRQHSQAAAQVIKAEGKENDLLERLQDDPAFAGIDLKSVMQTEEFTGCAGDQVRRFLDNDVAPIRDRYAAALSWKYEPRV